MSTAFKKPVVIGLAATAVVVLVAMLFRPSHGPVAKAIQRLTTQDPFEQAVRRMADAHTATYKLETMGASHSVSTGGRGTVEEANYGASQVEWIAPGHQRSVLPGGNIVITDRDAGQILMLIPDSNKAVVKRFDPQKPPLDIFAEARTLQHKADESLGEMPFGGRTIARFRAHGANGLEWVVWVDPATDLPVRVEATGGPLGGGKQVMSNFQFDAPLDKSFFSATPPPGYAVMNGEIKTAETEGGTMKTWKSDTVSLDPDKRTTGSRKGTEEGFVEWLRGYTEIWGTFPPTLSSGKMSSSVGMYGGAPATPEEREAAEKQFKAAVEKANAGLNFITSLRAENHWHYAGKGVKSGAPDTPIFWYQPDGSAKYRVIYADLSVKDAAPEALPKP